MERQVGFGALREEWAAWEKSWRGRLTRRLYYSPRQFLTDHIIHLQWYYDLKSFWLRGWYGWAPRDVWNMDCYLATIIPQMLRHLRDNHSGIPGILISDLPASASPEDHKLAGEMGSMKWNRLLTKWADAIESHTKELDLPENYLELPKKERQRISREEHAHEELRYENVKLALKEMADYFGHLWD